MTKAKHRGNIISEYGLVLALVSVLAIGALMLLGGNISKLLFGTGQDVPNQAEKLFSLVGASTDGTVVDDPGNPDPLDGGGGTQVRLVVDPATGRVSIRTSGSDTNTTSTQGGGPLLVGNLADQLGALAGFRDADGNPLPDDVQNLLRKLKENGHDLKDSYEWWERDSERILALNAQFDEMARQGKYSGPPYYDADMVSRSVAYTERHLQFAKTYNELAKAMDKLPPSFNQLKEKVNNYSGGISGTTHGNVGSTILSQFHFDRIRMGDALKAATSNELAGKELTRLTMNSLFMSASKRDSYFRNEAMKIAQKNVVGTPIDSNGLTITLDDPAPKQTAGG